MTTKKLATLVIHAPEAKAKKGAKRFEDVLADGVGVEYAIPRKDISKLLPGSTVVLLRKDKNKRRAEGVLVKLALTTNKTPQGIQRYDVHFEKRMEVLYKSERLNRFGVAVIDC